ncbi:MAG: septum formation initiator family protein [Elusimicrobiota bacterium]|jgi:cell division protein FtsB|nr:septum formation initiator family protein [Elusimicrobiota bacterium]
MKKETFYRIVRIVVILFLAYCFFLNRGALTVVKKLFEERKIKMSIAKVEEENRLLKLDIETLQNNRSYLIRRIKREYRVIGDGEIEYRFNNEN